MLINDFNAELTKMCDTRGITKSKLAEEMGISRQSLNKYMKHAKMPEGFMKVMEYLGYDIEVQYIKRRI